MERVSDSLASELTRMGERLLCLASELGSYREVIEPSRGAPLGAARDCMTLEQLAEYWDVSPSSIAKWQRRAPEDSPLPHGYVGDSPRFYRNEIEEWSRQERQRREAKKKQKKNKTGQKQTGKQTDSGFEGRMPATLTTAKAPKGESGHGRI